MPSRFPVLASRRLPLPAMRFGALVVLVAALAAIMLTMGPSRHQMIAAVAGSPLAPAVAVLGGAALAAALAPRTALAFVGGALFGAAHGGLYTVVGVTLGAALAFGVGRYLGRDFVADGLRGRLAAIEASVTRRGMVAVVVARLIPLVPFGVSNYAFGTTAIRFPTFVAGTLLGAAPATFAYAALGASTARGSTTGTMIAGASVIALGVAGSIGTFLVWRRRPQRVAVPELRADAPVSPNGPATPPLSPGRTDG
ncbi:MAG TPA: VTT domain-containing protein [Micromonosporaceae bacterium]